MFRTIYTYFRMYRYMLKYKKYIGEDYKENVKYSSEIASRTLVYAGYEVYIDGVENIPVEDGVLYTPNHQSFFDIFTIIAILNRQLSFVAKEKLRKYFNVGFYVESQGGILIDREDVKSQVRLIKELTELVKNGYNVVIFPEGTRSKDGTLSEFKSGSFRIAVKSKCPIVPITYFDNYDVVKNKGNKIIKMKIDKPITYDTYKDMNTNEISEYIRNIIENNLSKGFDINEATKYENPYK